MYMTQQMYRQFLTSRFGDAISIDYDPLEDGADHRVGTEVTVQIPRDARESFRRVQFMSIADLTGGFEWELDTDDSEIHLVIRTRRKLPEEFDDASDPNPSGTAHDDYVASLEAQIDGAPELRDLRPDDLGPDSTDD